MIRLATDYFDRLTRPHALMLSYACAAILLLKLSVKGNKTEFIIFIGQLLIAFVVALCGWIVTVSALARLDNRTSTATVSPAPAAPVAATA